MPYSEGMGTEAIREYLKSHPDVSNLGAARELFKRHRKLWNTQETCRAAVRRVRGACGEVRDKSQFSKASDRPKAPTLPEPLGELIEWKAIQIDRPGPVLVLSDLHIPHFDKKAVEVAVAEGVRRKAKTVLINGDLFDCATFSKFPKDPRTLDWQRDVQMGREVLWYLRQKFRKSDIFYKFGNHDLWQRKYIWGQAPAMAGSESCELDKQVGCDDFGVQVVKNNEPIRVGKLWAVHGHEWGKGGSSSPLCPAKTVFNWGNESIICGHWHRPSQFSSPTIAEHLISCWSTGCLCHLHPEYARLNQWAHGAAVVDIYKDLAYEVDNFRIRGGRKWS